MRIKRRIIGLAAGAVVLVVRATWAQTPQDELTALLAKSGEAANWQQGWHYTSLYFSIYAVLLLALIALVGMALWAFWQRRPPSHATPASTLGGASSIALLAAAHVLLNILYVTRLGGDFMFARFFIPITPLLLLILEDAVVSAIATDATE